MQPVDRQPVASPLPWPGQIPPKGLDDVYLIFPTRLGNLDLTGCRAVRALDDGRLLAVQPLMFGCAKLCIGRPEIMADNNRPGTEEGVMGAWDDTWDYPSNMAALLALATWEPDQAEEPSGWHRHPRTARRRAGGDPGREEVRP